MTGPKPPADGATRDDESARRSGGRGFQITGHHEILVPLLAHCVLERLRRG